MSYPQTSGHQEWEERRILLSHSINEIQMINNTLVGPATEVRSTDAAAHVRRV